MERLLKMEPKVECTGDSMKLQVQDAASTPGSLFFVDRGEFSVSCGVMNLQQSFIRNTLSMCRAVSCKKK